MNQQLHLLIVWSFASCNLIMDQRWKWFIHRLTLIEIFTPALIHNFKEGLLPSLSPAFSSMEWTLTFAHLGNCQGGICQTTLPTMKGGAYEVTGPIVFPLCRLEHGAVCAWWLRRVSANMSGGTDFTVLGWGGASSCIWQMGSSQQQQDCSRSG